MILLSHGAPLTPAGGSSCDMKAKNPYSSDSCNGIVKNDTERKKNCYKSFKSWRKTFAFFLFVSTGLFKISQFDLNDLKETFVRDESYSMKCLLFSLIVIDQHFEMSDEWKQCLMKMISWAVI